LSPARFSVVITRQAMTHPRKRKPRRRPPPSRERRAPRERRVQPSSRDRRGRTRRDRRAPAPAPAFSDAAFERHFAPILERYRNKLETLRRWRTLVNERAAALADFIKRTMDDAYANRVYYQVLGGVINAPTAESLPRPGHFDPRHLARVLGDPKGGEGAGRRVFDPWTGRWQGKWTSGPNRPASDTEPANPSPQSHVWDGTRQVDGATVQPVSQSERGWVDSSNVDSETDAGHTDLGINVYDDGAGLGGWVSKRQHGQSFELPHIGFRVAPGVLIWITQKHDRDGNALEDTFSVCVEWVDENGNYGILGRRFKLEGDSVRELTPAESYEGERHGGVYRKS
jgi:hypothetical protein